MIYWVISNRTTIQWDGITIIIVGPKTDCGERGSQREKERDEDR